MHHPRAHTLKHLKPAKCVINSTYIYHSAYTNCVHIHVIKLIVREAFSSSDERFDTQKVRRAGIVLKPEQLQAICHMYEGRDVFLWLPTGFGKSICYEI